MFSLNITIVWMKNDRYPLDFSHPLKDIWSASVSHSQSKLNEQHREIQSLFFVLIHLLKQKQRWCRKKIEIGWSIEFHRFLFHFICHAILSPHFSEYRFHGYCHAISQIIQVKRQSKQTQWEANVRSAAKRNKKILIDEM